MISSASSTPDRSVADLIARAESAVRLSGTDPRLALTQARAVLAEARSAQQVARAEAGSADPYAEVLSIALRAVALAARELGDLELAEERLREAIAAGAGFPRRVAQARMSLVAVRALLGDPEGGLRLADLAERHLTGLDLARLDVQRSVALMLIGRHRDAVHRCDRAIGRLGADPRFLAGGLLNRGVAHAYLEEYDAAEADLSECARIARAANLDHMAMLAEGNLPFVAARRGDVAAAFASYERAESGMSGYPDRLAAMRADFAEALVAARLPGEARAMLEQALPELTASGAHAVIPGARLLLAQAELLAGDAEQAAATAQTALAELLEQGRAAWAPLATEVILRARLAGPRYPRRGSAETGSEAESAVAALRACAADLDKHGWSGAASALRLTAARAALRAGQPAVARAELGLLTAPTVRPMVRQHALAMLRRLDGDLSGALAAVRAGVETLAVPSPGDAERNPELRAYAVRPAEDLAAYGLELALETGDAWAVLDWAERWRAIVRGRPAPAAVEHGHPEHRRPPDGYGTLVEFVRSGDQLWGVAAAAVPGGELRCVLRPLGSYQAAAEATLRIRYGLRRRNLRDLTAEPGTADLVAAELAVLDRQLLHPLEPAHPPGSGGSDNPSSDPVVIVPTGALCTLPWPLLPSLAGRPVSVAPDANCQVHPATRTGAPLVVSVAGPGLRHASAEADMVVMTHTGAERIPATRRQVLAALERADVLHVAAHGVFSPRSPMLSSITLDDGPLMAYDLLGLDRVPRVVVLSACDSGMAHAPADGAALGLAGTFLDRGAAFVIAGVIPVRDDEALALMTVFHALLAEGRSPAAALGAAAVKTGVGGFVCYGDARFRGEAG